MPWESSRGQVRTRRASPERTMAAACGIQGPTRRSTSLVMVRAPCCWLSRLLKKHLPALISSHRDPNLRYLDLLVRRLRGNKSSLARGTRSDEDYGLVNPRLSPVTPDEARFISFTRPEFSRQTIGLAELLQAGSSYAQRPLSRPEARRRLGCGRPRRQRASRVNCGCTISPGRRDYVLSTQGGRLFI